MLTFVWVLTEFLCFARYQRVVDPVALPEFLARIYALLQLAEFTCIALFAGPVTRWVPPIWRRWWSSSIATRPRMSSSPRGCMRPA